MDLMNVSCNDEEGVDGRYPYIVSKDGLRN
jgi:hypothetical protein